MEITVASVLFALFSVVFAKSYKKKIIEEKEICEDVRSYWGWYSGCSGREMVSIGNKKKVNIHALAAHFIGSCVRFDLVYSGNW